MKKLVLATLGLALVLPAVASAQTVTFLDNFGFCWTLTLVDQQANRYYLEGTSNRGGAIWSATATFQTGRLTVASNPEGQPGVPFDYNLKYPGGTGAWKNIHTAPTSHGEVTSFVQTPCLTGRTDYQGTRPGEQ